MSVASIASPSARRSRVRERLAILALFVAAFMIASSPILVRLSPVGPTASAFYRMALGLPALALWTAIEQRRAGAAALPAARDLRQLWLAGCCFAGDLAAWHWSIRLTVIANAALLANLSPLLVTIGARYLFGERISGGFAIAALGALAGSALLTAGGIHSSGALLGDFLAIVAALFYAGYFLAVRGIRERLTTAATMAWSGFASSVILLLLALGSNEPMLPATGQGWAILFTLALAGQLLGQCLVAWALAHLPVSFAALTLLLQPVIATLLSWRLLGEPLTLEQCLGGSIILISIIAARRASGQVRIGRA